ncbi:PepSY-associated TM helix domain-containing protein [Quadrisphaera setariae]|uniref:PepSY domain-containing protein n=1 Tax=Quadrisphaera setariae TaxID=2593304 RepID=A0A5C8ZHF5_9ACTN|nr:PepSY-associated TM helix domain-containing protein [Quadrisphaera setariae]TXR56974.1 PepSY domain-containing protein [Quadrisphaera setariae]
MTASHLTPPTAPTAPAPAPATSAAGPSAWSRLRPLVLRLHFFAGVLVAPFILVAAVTGGLYAVAPQVEQVVYDHELHVAPSATALPLDAQVSAALTARGAGSESTLLAVRPAPTPSDTTRVLFSDPSLGESYRLAVFVDPGTGEVRGQLPVYGTSGSLPLRAWVSELHRNLHLGEPGRVYSELAASWLAVLAVSGLALWTTRRVTSHRLRRTLLLQRGTTGRARTRSLHGVTGTWMLLGLLALSATGLTWSTYAGERVTALRSALAWETPAVDTALGDATAGAGAQGSTAGHEDHTSMAGTAGMDGSTPSAADLAAQTTSVLAAARAAGLDSAQVEVELPADATSTWKVDEVHRSWPEQVGSAAVAVDAPTAEGGRPSAHVVDVVRFSDYPFMAKMARWGIDAHSGSLFGLANQLVLLALAAGITASVLWGYRMWWQRRPDRSTRWGVGRPAQRGAHRWLPLPALVVVLVVTAAVAWALPVLGVSLALFLLVDAVTGAVVRTRTT